MCINFEESVKYKPNQTKLRVPTTRLGLQKAL